MEEIYFSMVRIAPLALGEFQTIIVKGRKRTNRERKRKGEGKKERNRGGKEGGKCCGLYTGWKRVSRHEAE